MSHKTSYRWACATLAACWMVSIAQAGLAQEPGRASFVVEPTAQLFGSQWRERAEYQPTDFEGESPAPKGKQRRSFTGAGGELGLMLGVRLGDHVQLGPYGRFGYAGKPNAFTDAVKASSTASLGLQLTLSQHADAGFYAQARGGLGWLAAHRGWSAALGLGYSWACRERWYLGMGIESSVSGASYGENGDFGRYDYASLLVSTGLAMRLRYRAP